MSKHWLLLVPLGWAGWACLSAACTDPGVDETVVGAGAGGDGGRAGSGGLGGGAGNGMGGCGYGFGGGCGGIGDGGSGGVNSIEELLRLYPPGDAACSEGACLDVNVCVAASGKSCRCPETLPAACTNLTFQTLPLPEGTQTCIARATSADGAITVGSCWSFERAGDPAANDAVVWSSSHGAEVLEADSAHPMEAAAVNGDGTVILWSSWEQGSRHSHLRQRGGPTARDVSLQSSLGAGEELIASALSADGTVVVGSLQAPEAAMVAFRWTEGSGIVRLPVRESGGGAFGVSDHGEVVVGSASAALGTSVAMRWTAQGDAEELALPPNVSGALAYAVNADGSVVVGATVDPVQALRWTAGGVDVLGPAHGAAMLVNADGRRVFGDDGERAWMWDEEHGTRALEEILQQAGLGPDWLLYRVTDVSADGNVVVGMARFRSDPALLQRLYAFRARLPAF